MINAIVEKENFYIKRKQCGSTSVEKITQLIDLISLTVVKVVSFAEIEEIRNFQKCLGINTNAFENEKITK